MVFCLFFDVSGFTKEGKRNKILTKINFENCNLLPFPSPFLSFFSVLTFFSSVDSCFVFFHFFSLFPFFLSLEESLFETCWCCWRNSPLLQRKGGMKHVHMAILMPFQWFGNFFMVKLKNNGFGNYFRKMFSSRQSPTFAQCPWSKSNLSLI